MAQRPTYGEPLRTSEINMVGSAARQRAISSIQGPRAADKLDVSNKSTAAAKIVSAAPNKRTETRRYGHCETAAAQAEIDARSRA
jgi:hypothetical protein